MPGSVKVEVKGLKEFSTALRKTDAELPKMLRIALNGCSDFLIGKTRPQVPRKTGRAASSLKARSTRTSVRVAAGGRKAPYYPWLDFGGKIGRNNSVVRPFIADGRYLYPTFRKNRDEFTTIMEKAIVGVAESAGLQVD